MKSVTTNINGYIEGYYGRIFTWPERHSIIKKLNKCNFNTYFYCPKDDLKHRINWREDYNNQWLSALNNFCNSAKEINVNVLVGISPGLDYSFLRKNDFDNLIKKALQLKSTGASKIVLMFDDIPPYRSCVDKRCKSEGSLHAELANSLSIALSEDIFVVPRIYSDELIEDKCTYLENFNKNLNKNITIFYCGKKIISDTNKKSELNIIRKTTSNHIIFWDNLYANDYCPSRLFIGPYIGRKVFNNTMINPTGLIKTDLLILDLIKLSVSNKDWKNALKINGVPEEFYIIDKYFFPINFLQKNKCIDFDYYEEIKALDFLLWKWKTNLSREWYPYLLILKQNLQLLNNDLDCKRIKKIFPIPLSKAINNQKGD